MPVYTTLCDVCQKTQDIIRSIDRRDEDLPVCHEKAMRRIIVSPSMVIGDIEPYQSMVDGSMIMGRAEHKAHLKQHRLLEVGDQTHHLKPYGQYKPGGMKRDLVESMQRVKEQHRRR